MSADINKNIESVNKSIDKLLKTVTIICRNIEFQTKIISKMSAYFEKVKCGARDENKEGEEQPWQETITT